MIRPMRWHIYNIEDEPMTWDDFVLEFDTEDSAQSFLDKVEECTGEFFDDIRFKNDILYYDSGYCDATNAFVDDYGEIDGLVFERRK